MHKKEDSRIKQFLQEHENAVTIASGVIMGAVGGLIACKAGYTKGYNAGYNAGFDKAIATDVEIMTCMGNNGFMKFLDETGAQTTLDACVKSFENWMYKQC